MLLLTHHIDLRSYSNESCAHTHDFAQLVLPVSGSMELEAGHYAYVVNEDRGIYIAPHEQHCFSATANNLFVVIDVAANPIFPKNKVSHALPVTESAKKLLQFTHHYLATNQRDAYSDSLIHQLLMYVTDYSFSGDADRVVMKAKHWMDCHCIDPIDVSRVAKHCYLSVSQLQRRFKPIMGCNLAEYWRMKKLHYAKSLLLQRNIAIETIAFAVGYENVSAFSRRFTQKFGESPLQWRAKRLTAKKMREMDN